MITFAAFLHFYTTPCFSEIAVKQPLVHYISVHLPHLLGVHSVVTNSFLDSCLLPGSTHEVPLRPKSRPILALA